MQQLSFAEQDLIGGIDGTVMLARVTDWCAINSGSRNLTGLAAMADRLTHACAALPGTVRTEQPVTVTEVAADGSEHAAECGAHVVLSVRPDANRRLLLTGHMDTVFATDHPFQALTWRDGETINAPGAADMKGGIAVMLAALAAFETSPDTQRIGYDVVFNSDEEIGSPSSAQLITRLARGKFAALTYEPAALPDGTLAGERAGSANFSAVITGRAAHAGRNPQDGRNAIVAAAALVIGLKQLEHAGISVNPARIEGGSAVNVVPDGAVVRFNTRPRDLAAADSFELELAQLVSRVAHEHDVGLHIHHDSRRPPKPMDPATQRLFELVRSCGAALGQTIGWQSSGGVCDGNNIAACGVPVVDTLGVRGGAIHSSDEYLIVPSLAERAALSAVLLNRLAAGDVL